MSRRRLLLLGHTGKLGTALAAAFADHEILGRNSASLDVADLAAVERTVGDVAPDLIVNAAAMLGLDACEAEPSRAARINTLLPALLARLAGRSGAVLVHFSTESVFSGAKGDFLTESDIPDPINVYGFSKYASELAVAAACQRHYLFRLPLLFGPAPARRQLVERMVDRVRAGERSLRIADDIVTSPTYTLDAAAAIRDALDGGLPWGLYHLANDGRASLFDLIAETLRLLDLDAEVARASRDDFPGRAAKQSVTPLRSERLAPLRGWREALAAYCAGEREGAP